QHIFIIIMESAAAAAHPTNRWIPFLAGGIAGVTAKSAVAPLERVKILYQIRSDKYGTGSITGSISKIKQLEGIKGLWRGNTATITRVFPYAAVQFFTFETIKRVYDRPFSSFNMFIAGSLAGGVAVLATYPLDLLRARLAIEVTEKQTGMANLFFDIVKRDGIRGVYRGIESTIIGILPYAGISFSTFETLKAMAPNWARDDEGKLHPTYKLFSGGMAGGIAQTVAYPFDVVRRRMQTHGFGDGRVHIDVKHSSFRSIYRILTQEGVKNLYKGLSINYIKVIPTSAIAFYTYELSTQILSRLS
ncbi:hypothetical protein SAMD00019534_065570, partial [Acytostelium subglobosum LB1]|uniref:hypothetical protein n=1 Tax=Acytostelium subglobosum LB1 TaxID=1410327 RepID=UPI000644A477